LGIYGGDDGASGDADRKSMELAAKHMGLSLDLERVMKGELGVHFLARYYGPDVWFGDVNSVCDIRRQASKFHLTIALPSSVTPQMKLVDKSMAFYVSDVHTPVIGDFVSRVRELFPELWPRSYGEWENIGNLWRPDRDIAVQYPNDVASWATDLLELQMPNFDYGKFLVLLEKANRETILTLDNCDTERPPAEVTSGQVLVDDDLIGEPEPPVVPVEVTVAVSDDPAIPIVETGKRTEEANTRTSFTRKRKPRSKSRNRSSSKSRTRTKHVTRPRK